MKSWELGPSDGASKRMEIVGRVIDEARVKRWGRGLSNGVGMGQVRVGDRVVGGSYLHRRLKSGECDGVGTDAPNTHDKELMGFDRHFLMEEYLCKAEQSSSITSRTFREHDDRTIGIFSQFL